MPQNQSIPEMIQTPVIVTFANQKGGVGKTTLCVTFANYLVKKGVRVVVIDCDFQHSIMKCRKADCQMVEYDKGCGRLVSWSAIQTTVQRKMPITERREYAGWKRLTSMARSPKATSTREAITSFCRWMVK